jgi:hypothetical protein
LLDAFFEACTFEPQAQVTDSHVQQLLVGGVRPGGLRSSARSGCSAIGIAVHRAFFMMLRQIYLFGEIGVTRHILSVAREIA